MSHDPSINPGSGSLVDLLGMSDDELLQAAEAGGNLRWSKVTAEDEAAASEASLMGDNGPLDALLDLSLEHQDRG